MLSASSESSKPPQRYAAILKILRRSESISQQSRESKPSTLRTKITVGYISAAIIPVVGALVGSGVGDYYQQKAIHISTTTYQEQRLLNNLQVMILQNRPAKELTPFARDATAFQQASDEILTRVDRLQGVVIQLEQAETQTIIDFIPQLQEYQKTLDTFSQEFEGLVQESQLLLAEKNSDRLKQRILELVNSDSFSHLIQFADQINDVTMNVDHDILIAQEKMQQAETLRTQIILGSLVASIITASLMAILTSQAIARPLESLTHVAQQVTHDANINLRATVSSQDEVGMLAKALNQLLEWVDTYTKELQSTQLHLVQAEKMSSLGQLVAGVAHEINNPVNFIYGNTIHIDAYIQDLLKVIQAYQTHYPNPPQTLQETLDEVELDFLNEDLIKLLQSMKVGTERIRQIVLSLRNFSRLDESEFKAVDIHEGIDNSLLILQHRLKAGSKAPAIEVITNYGQLPLVECYPAQLNQVFMNLLVNAIDAVQEAAQQTKDEHNTQSGSIWISTQLAGENQVQIAIADSGMGISETVRSRIFDPFFTTKPMSKGTGLGLSISYQIVTEKHHGKIWFDSTPGNGTKFILEIPVRQVETVKNSAQSGDRPSPFPQKIRTLTP